MSSLRNFTLVCEAHTRRLPLARFDRWVTDTPRRQCVPGNNAPEEVIAVMAGRSW